LLLSPWFVLAGPSCKMCIASGESITSRQVTRNSSMGNSISDGRDAEKLTLAGGVLGGVLGIMLAVRLSSRKRALNYIFATLIFMAAGYILLRTGTNLFPT